MRTNFIQRKIYTLTGLENFAITSINPQAAPITLWTRFSIVLRSSDAYSSSLTQAFLVSHSPKTSVILIISKIRLQVILPTIQWNPILKSMFQPQIRENWRKITLQHLLLQHSLPSLSQKVASSMMLLLFFLLLLFSLLFLSLQFFL